MKTLSELCENLKIRADKDRALLIELSIPEKDEEDFERMRMNYLGHYAREAEIALKIRKHLEENP